MIQLTLTLALLFQNPAIDSPSPKERQAAIEKMAVLGNREAIPTLAAALSKEPKADIRAQIIAALGRIGDREAISPLADTLHTDLDKDVRAQAIDSLLRLYIPLEESGPLRTIFNKVKSAFMEPDSPVVGPQVQVDSSAKEALALSMQKDFDDDVRAQAARALGSLRAKDQLPTLIAALEDPRNREHSKVRIEIAHALGAIRDPAAGPPLERALRDSDKRLVQEVILSLGLVGYKDASPAIQEIFRTSSDRVVKSRALASLALLRDQGSVSVFERYLTDKDDYYRELSAEGLARLKYDGAKDWKTRFDQEPKSNVRNALAYGLAASGNPDYIKNLANALDTRQSSQAEVYLYELGKFDGRVNELQRYLRSTNPKVRGGVARILGNVGDPSSIDQIRPLTEDTNAEVAREAVSALRKLSR